MKAAAFVLAGGRSSRMGRDKALLPLRSGLLIESVVEKLNAVANASVIVGAPERYGHLGIECLPDLHAGMGPLSGIEAALASRRGELNLIVACDMPRLQTSWLRRLLMAAMQRNERCVITREPDGMLQPLCAVYRSDCLGPVETALKARRLKLVDIVRELGALPLQIDSTIVNVNTPHEWVAWREGQLL